MIRGIRSIRLLTGVLLSTLVLLVFSTCGGIGGSDFAGGGTGGTGISTGTVTDFGSVVVNGVHFRTDGNVAPGFVTKKIFNGKDNSARMDRDLFRVGMVVTIRHSPDDNNAQVIEYRDNLEGPIAEKSSGTDNSVFILGQIVVLEDGTVFASLDRKNVVEISGYVDAAGRIHATYVQVQRQVPRPDDEFELKGFISHLSLSDNTFRLGPLPDGSGTTVTVSFDPAAVSTLLAGPADGMYVQVATVDTEPVSGKINAARVEKLVARTEFPEKTAADLEGLVTTPPSGFGNVFPFAVEGKQVQAEGATMFIGGTAADIRIDARLQVQGTENGGVLSAAKIVFVK
jgi:hypothetical protein